MIPEKIVTIDNTAPTGIYVVHGGTNLMLISCLLQYLKCITSSLMSVIVKTTWKFIFDIEIRIILRLD